MPDSLTGKEGEEIRIERDWAERWKPSAREEWESGEQISHLTSHRAAEKSNLVEIRGAIFHILQPFLAWQASAEIQTFDTVSERAGENKRGEKLRERTRDSDRKGGGGGWIEIAQRMETERDTVIIIMNNDSLIEWPDAGFSNQLRNEWGGGQPPACPPARPSVICQTQGYSVPCVFHWRSLPFVSHSEGFCSVSPRPNRAPHVPAPCKQSQCVGAVCETLVLKAPCPLQLWADNSWRRVVGLCSLSLYTPPPRPTSPSSMFPWNRPVIFTAVSPAVCQGESRKQRLRRRGRKRGWLMPFRGLQATAELCKCWDTKDSLLIQTRNVHWQKKIPAAKPIVNYANAKFCKPHGGS